MAAYKANDERSRGRVFIHICMLELSFACVCVCVRARTPGAYVREGEGGSRTGGELVVVVGILEMIFNVGKR